MNTEEVDLLEVISYLGSSVGSLDTRHAPGRQMTQ